MTRNTNSTSMTVPSSSGKTSLSKMKCDGLDELDGIEGEWYETSNPWHLIIEDSDRAATIRKEFHQNFKVFRSSSNIRDKIALIREEFSEQMKPGPSREKMLSYLERARKEDDPKLLIKAYTLDQNSKLHSYSAKNTYHSLKLYCTILNCPILARTQQYTETFTSILFHPKLDDFMIRTDMTVYRGSVIKNKKLIEDIEKGVVIITTTFVSTSKNKNVAEMFASRGSSDQIEVLFTYHLYGTRDHTALDIGPISECPHEDEVLILRYIAFKVTSVVPYQEKNRFEIYCDEYVE